MSKCWYCNNELTTGDNPKHFGICNKCYDKMFKSGDTIIRSLTNKIADLETKLAECEKKAYSRGHSQRDIANEIKLNALREDVANKEKRIVELKKQLAENEKEISEYVKIVDDLHKQLSDKCDFCDKTKDQDKISFAVEKLEQVKEEMDLRPRGVSKGWKNKEYDTLVEEDVYEVIDNQIKQLKEKK